MSDHELEKTPQLDELKENFEKIDALTKRLIAIMAQQRPNNQSSQTPVLNCFSKRRRAISLR